MRTSVPIGFFMSISFFKAVGSTAVSIKLRRFCGSQIEDVEHSLRFQSNSADQFLDLRIAAWSDVTEVEF